MDQAEANTTNNFTKQAPAAQDSPVLMGPPAMDATVSLPSSQTSKHSS